MSEIKEKKKRKPKEMECWFCGKAVTKDFYCYGCRQYICGECDTGNPDFGKHKPEEHRG